MPKLFGRKSRVVVGTSKAAGIDVSQHRHSFEVVKTLKPLPNTCTLKIYNLSPAQRASIAELAPPTATGNANSATTGVSVLIEAGYVTTDAAQIFLGDLRVAYSTKEGQDWITTIESGTNEKAQKNARVNVTIGPKAGADTALRAIAKALGVGDGNIAPTLAKLRASGVAQMLTHGLVISGSASFHMTNFCNSAGLEWSVQDGVLQILDRDKALSTFAVKLESDSGLLESPTVDHKGFMQAKCLLNPDVRPGVLVTIDSQQVKGTYRVEKATYEGDTYDNPWWITLEGKRF
jgi:hypothetical protein